MRQAWLESRAFLSCALLAYWQSQETPLLESMYGLEADESLMNMQVRVIILTQSTENARNGLVMHSEAPIEWWPGTT